MRQEVEEIGERANVHLALNAILNNDKNIVKVIFGEPVAVMKAGIPLVQQLCQVNIEKPYDFVIASAGGYPKDINLYQAQKALTHAAMMTKDGGTILLLAACVEGVGSAGYEHFMNGITSFDEVFVKFRQLGFQVGPHKAYQIARDASRVNIIMLSKMDPAKVKQLLLTPAGEIDETIKKILANLPEGNRIAIMPIAPITIPSLVTNQN
jgi:nickel-dependent lactate racemase